LPGSGDLMGSYNLNLSMYNWLRIFNASGAWQVITVKVYNTNGVPNTRQIELPANNGIDLGIHEYTNYGTTADTYGLVDVQGTQLLTELLRIRPTTAGTIDFAAPTKVR
jgi:hypothetical protein